MKDKATYICVETTEVIFDGRHVGTLQVHDDTELNTKLKQALESHFDAEVTINQDQTIESIKYGQRATFNIEIEDYGVQEITFFNTWFF